MTTVTTSSSLSKEELEHLKILMDPVTWAKVYLSWTARDYQIEPLRATAKHKLNVFRMGRRLGKTEVTCVSILWHAFTQPNKKPVRSKAEDQYNILIVTPGEAQIKLIFDRLHQLIAASPVLQACIARDIENRIEFTNGTIITGLTAGSKSNTGAQNTRGQRADLIVLDECDYLQDKDINNLINIRNEAPERIKIIAASTPTGKRAAFFRWCTGAPHNGWMEHYAPSTVNPEIHKVNPDTGLTYLEELRQELSALAFEQEVMANFGEEASGVYRKVDIDAAIELGRQLGLTYWHNQSPERRGPRVLGVDWDKYQSGVCMASVEFDYELGKFIPFHAEEVPRTQFTLDTAVNRILELDALHNYDYIVVDRGYGEYQVERLSQLLNARQKGSYKKLIDISLSEKIPVRNPVTRQIEMAHIKPWIVNQSVLQFERHMIAFNPRDTKMIEQFENYRVVSIGADGRPTYTDKNEHFVDAVNFAIYGLIMKFTDVAKAKPGTAIASLPKPLVDTPVQNRDLEKEEPKKLKKPVAIGFISIGMGGGRSSGRGGRIGSMPSRRRI